MKDRALYHISKSWLWTFPLIGTIVVGICAYFGVASALYQDSVATIQPGDMTQNPWLINEVFFSWTNQILLLPEGIRVYSQYAKLPLTLFVLALTIFQIVWVIKRIEDFSLGCTQEFVDELQTKQYCLELFAVFCAVVPFSIACVNVGFQTEAALLLLPTALLHRLIAMAIPVSAMALYVFAYYASITVALIETVGILRTKKIPNRAELRKYFEHPDPQKKMRRRDAQASHRLSHIK